MTAPVVFLDLDGTLIEPSEGIFACIRYALQRLGEPAPPDNELREWVGPPLRDSFAALLGNDRADAAVAAYRERYSDVGWRECTLYPDIAAALDALVDAGFRLVLATSKPGVYARRIVRLHDIDGVLSDVCGAELDGRLSHKEELLAFANDRHGQRGIAMLGDRRYDVAGARRNGLRALGATWGFGSREELEGAGADRLLDSPLDVLAALNDIGQAEGN